MSESLETSTAVGCHQRSPASGLFKGDTLMECSVHNCLCHCLFWASLSCMGDMDECISTGWSLRRLLPSANLRWAFLSSLLVSTGEFVQRIPAWLACCLSQAHHQSVCSDFPICSTQLLEAALANLLLSGFLRHVSLVSPPCPPTPGNICRLFDQS